MTIFFKELWNFLKVRKKYWLLPFIIVFAVMGILLLLSHGSEATPFIYTIF